MKAEMRFVSHRDETKRTSAISSYSTGLTLRIRHRCIDCFQRLCGLSAQPTFRNLFAEQLRQPKAQSQLKAGCRITFADRWPPWYGRKPNGRIAIDELFCDFHLVGCGAKPRPQPQRCGHDARDGGEAPARLISRNDYGGESGKFQSWEINIKVKSNGF